MTVAAELAAWTLGPSPEQATAAARRAAVRHLLDGVGCALASARSGAAVPAVTVALAVRSPSARSPNSFIKRKIASWFLRLSFSLALWLNSACSARRRTSSR